MPPHAAASRHEDVSLKIDALDRRAFARQPDAANRVSTRRRALLLLEFTTADMIRQHSL